MKKLLGILVLGLFWCGAVISAEKNITGVVCVPLEKKNINEKIFRDLGSGL